jgi:hypothetical protein
MPGRDAYLDELLGRVLINHADMSLTCRLGVIFYAQG